MSYLIALSNLLPIKTVEKVWGRELWLVNEKNYCAKILEINEDYQCSLHYHPIKQETFVVLHGSIKVECGFEKKVLIPGEKQEVPAGTPHRFGTLYPRGAAILEISTHHDDSDVVRIEESKKI